MGYVMVPVPAHHQQEFSQWLLRTTVRAELLKWNPEKLGTVLASFSDEDRDIVSRVAAVQGYWMDGFTLAEDLGIDIDELTERVVAMNERCDAAEAPPIIMYRTADQNRSGRPNFMVINTIRDDVIAALG